MGSWYQLFVGVLAVWRITHLLNAEHGPWRIVSRIREAIAETNVLRELLTCFLCLSVWIAAPFAYLIGDTWEHRLLLLPALSAGAIMLERVTAQPKTKNTDAND